jgi:methylmalonyl-CoA/ethylmalonyl-CoA epimerase
MIAGVAFDHVAVAAPDRSVLNRRYAGDLGVRYVVEGATAGLYATLLRCGNGVKFEVVEPHGTDHADYLARFLERHGPGFHHVTFKVADVPAAAAEAEAAGYRLIGSHTDFLVEVFLHPKDAMGLVVQLIEPREHAKEPPPGFPTGPAPADLRHVALAVSSFAGAEALLVDLLGGEVVDEGKGPEGTWRDVDWGPGRVRAVEAGPGTPLAGWLGGRIGAVHHLAFALDDPAAVPDAVPCDEGTWEIAPERNWGVRLRLTAR